MTTTADPQTIAPSTEAAAAPPVPPRPPDPMDLRQRILGRSRPRGAMLEVPEWDTTVELRSMNVAEKADLIGDVGDEPAAFLKELLPGVIILTCYDPDTGERIFDEDDLDSLLEEPAGIVERIGKRGLRLSGIGGHLLAALDQLADPEEEPEEEPIEAGKDDSSSTRTGSTGSPSPSG